MSQKTLHLLLLDSQEDRRQAFSRQLANFDDIHLEAPEREVDPETYFAQDLSQVVLLDGDYMGDGYGFGAALLANFPEKAVLLLEDQPNVDKLKQALVAGFSDIVASDIESEQLIETIYRSQLNKSRSLELIREDKTKKTQTSYGKIITVFSTKGGVGRTFTALNLAVLLKKQNDARVALVDLDVDYGTLALAMGLQGKTTINDVLGDLRNLDGDLLDSYMLNHDSGVKVLSSTGEPQLDSYVNSEQIEIILRTLQDNYDFVVVDLPGRFMEMITPAFTLASLVYMVTTPDILALSNVKAGLGLLKDLNFPSTRLKIVLNQAGRKSLSKADVEKSLDASVFVIIPYDQAAHSSLNLGIPFVQTNPRSKTTRALQALVEGFARER